MKPKRPCKFCTSTSHYPTFCPRRPQKAIKQISRRSRKPIPTGGNKAKKWARFRNHWKKEHKDEEKYCWICGKYLPEGTYTLDHVIPRSRRPDLVFEESNIRPACWICNSEKGSKVITKEIS